MAEAGEVEGSVAAGVAPGLVHGAEDGLAAVEGARVEGPRTLRARDGDGVGDGRCGLCARRSVVEAGVGVGAEEGEDEEGGQGLDDPAGFIEAQHFAGRGGGWGSGERRVGGGWHGSFRLGTASHGCAGGVAEEKQIPALRCEMTARKQE